MEETQEEEKEKTIESIEKKGVHFIQNIAKATHNVTENVTSVPGWAYVLLVLYIFVTPYVGWFYSWSWWPSMLIYSVLLLIFVAVVSYWGRLRRRLTLK